MRLFAYSVLDKKAATYGTPFFTSHTAHAVRMVQQAANDATTSLGRYPADFALYEIGYFDDQSAELVPIGQIKFVCELVSLVDQPVELPLFDQDKE